MATATYDDGSERDVSAEVSWSSADPSVASVEASGLVRGVAEGSALITASLDGTDATTTVTVSAVALVSIAIEPTTPMLAAGTLTGLRATGTYSDGTTEDLTAQVTWATTDGGVASVAADGTLSASNAGSTEVTATLGDTSTSADVTVTDATLDSIVVEPVDPTVPVGLTLALSATGIFSDGSSQDITTQVAWSSSADSEASVSADGTLTGVSPGTPVITATLSAVSGDTTVTVTSASLVSIEVTPASASLPAGGTQTFVAVGTFSDGSQQDISDQVSWSSDDTAIASVDGDGLATGVAAGAAEITASLGSEDASADLTVTDAVLTSVAVTPADASIAVGTTQAYQALGNYSDGTQQDVTLQVTWASSDPSVAVIGNALGAGGAQGLSAGTTQISANLDGVSGAVTLLVTDVTLESIDVVPDGDTFVVGETPQFTATATFSDGSQQDVTGDVAWWTRDQSVFTVSNAPGSEGLGDAAGPGDTRVVAALDGIFGNADVSVEVVGTLESILVTPADSNMVLGMEQPFTATAVTSAGQQFDVTDDVVWSSSDDGIVSVSTRWRNRGVGTAEGAGTATVSATLDMVEGSTSVTVQDLTLVSIAISPTDIELEAWSSQAVTAMGTFSDGSMVDLSTTVDWSSDDNEVAAVGDWGDQGAEVWGTGAGETTIRAEWDGVEGSTSVTVTGGGDGGGWPGGGGWIP